jgi:hypothetical protein
MSYPCGTVAGMVTPKGSMSTKGLALRPGETVITYIFIEFDLLCAACVRFPPSSTGAPVPLRACGLIVGETKNRSDGTEPSISEEEMAD